jgi:hypothetical protein
MEGVQQQQQQPKAGDVDHFQIRMVAVWPNLAASFGADSVKDREALVLFREIWEKAKKEADGRWEAMFAWLENGITNDANQIREARENVEKAKVGWQATAAEKERLQNELAGVRTELIAVQRELAAYKESIKSMASSASGGHPELSAGRPAEISITKFDGARTAKMDQSQKIKVRDLYNTWKRQITLQMTTFPNRYTTESAKLRLAAAYLEGEAGKITARIVYEDHSKLPPDQWAYKDLDALFKTLDNIYDSTNIVAENEELLKKLKQDNDTWPEFYAKFCCYHSALNYDNRHKVNQLEDKVNDNVKALLASVWNDKPSDTDLDGWVRMLSRLDDNARRLLKKGPYKSQTGGSQPYGHQDEGEPMDLDKVNALKEINAVLHTRGQHLTEAEHEQLYRANKCFGCKDDSHRWSQCPENPKRQSNWGRGRGRGAGSGGNRNNGYRGGRGGGRGGGNGSGWQLNALSAFGMPAPQFNAWTGQPLTTDTAGGGKQNQISDQDRVEELKD